MSELVGRRVGEILISRLHTLIMMYWFSENMYLKVTITHLETRSCVSACFNLRRVRLLKVRRGGGIFSWPDGEGGSISRSYCDTQASRPLMSSQQQARGAGGANRTWGAFTVETQVLQMGSPPIQAATCRRGETFGSPQDKPCNVREREAQEGFQGSFGFQEHKQDG